MEFTIDLDNDKFNGTATVTVSIDEEVKYIVLHAATSLKIISQSVTDSNQNPLKIASNFTYEPLEFLVLEMENTVQPGEIKLNFEFESDLATDMFGIYKSVYVNSEGNNVKLVSTQFQVLQIVL